MHSQEEVNQISNRTTVSTTIWSSSSMKFITANEISPIPGSGRSKRGKATMSSIKHCRTPPPPLQCSFALLSGQLNTLNKVLKHEKTPLVRNQVVIPLVLSPDRDEDLMRQTGGRISVFSHEVDPDHLRTKPDPKVEEQEKQLTTDATHVGADAAQKQIQSLNKMCSNLLEKINKEERESESGGLWPNKQTFNPADTNALVAAVAFGKGLSNWRPSGSSGPSRPGQPGTGTVLTGASGLQQMQMAGAPNQQQPMLSGVQMAQAGQPGKMPSGINTNIKSASMHPYQQ